MYCINCGVENGPLSRFCGNCGRAAGAGQPAPGPAGRFSNHFRLLGLLWISESALRLVPGLVLLALAGAGGALLQHRIPFGLTGVVLVWMPILIGIGAVLSASALGGIIAGWGLLERKPWARTLALILGLISLPQIPFGTALGVYTLWVLLPGEAEQEYQSESAAGTFA